MEEKLLLAIVSGVLDWGARRISKWLATQQTLNHLPDLSPSELVAAGLTPTQAHRTVAFFKQHSLESFYELLERNQIKCVTLREDSFPKLLLETNDAPYVLFYRGELRNDLSTISVVGTRKPTHYGKQVTEMCTRHLVQNNVGIVSGLAYGVDTIAHKTTLDNNGYTIAVLGSAIDEITPIGNTVLGRQVLSSGGALVSEYGPGYKTKKQNFIARNRIVSGLSQAVLITEGAESSGSLATAEFALKQKRIVYAVPGNITSPMSQAPNQLIQQGATIVTKPSDIVVSGAPRLHTIVSKQPVFDSEIESKVYLCLLESEKSVQEVCVETKLSIIELNQILTMFELQGLITQSGGMVRVRK